MLTRTDHNIVGEGRQCRLRTIDRACNKAICHDNIVKRYGSNIRDGEGIINNITHSIIIRNIRCFFNQNAWRDLRRSRGILAIGKKPEIIAIRGAVCSTYTRTILICNERGSAP